MAGHPHEPTEPERARALMTEGATRLVEGVRQGGAAWVVARVTEIVDAWGGIASNEGRAAVLAAARRAGEQAAARVTRELTDLFARDPSEQRTTPLEVVRSLRYEATAVLASAGVPPIERDPFDTRSFPDDVYGIVPRAITELGFDDTTRDALGTALLAWGTGKARLVPRDP